MATPINQAAPLKRFQSPSRAHPIVQHADSSKREAVKHNSSPTAVSSYFSAASADLIFLQKALCEETFFDAIYKINASAKSKTTTLIPDIVLGIQEKWSALNLSDNLITDAIIKVHSLQIEGLSEFSQCEKFIHAVYTMAQHRDFFRRIGTPSKRPTEHIRFFFQQIGYVRKLNYALTPKHPGVYCGYVVNTKPHGFGTFVNTQTPENNGPHKGFRYEGAFQNGAFNGFGLFTWGSGARHEGEVKDNAKNGFGVFTSRDGKHSVGHYIDDSPCGFSIETKPNDDIYEGTYHTRAFNGFCVVTYANGDCFEGAFENHLKNGFGVLKDAHGIIKEEGFWINDHMAPPNADAEELSFYRAMWEVHKQEFLTYKEFHSNALKAHRKKMKAHYAPHISVASGLIANLAEEVADFL